MRLLPVLLAALAPGCFISRTALNDPIPEASIEGLVPGVSTAEEVVAALGAPIQVVELGERSAYHYLYRRQKRAGLTFIVLTFINEDNRPDRVWVFFDENDVLTHVASTFSADDTRYALPWQNMDAGDDE